MPNFGAGPSVPSADASLLLRLFDDYLHLGCLACPKLALTQPHKCHSGAGSSEMKMRRILSGFIATVALSAAAFYVYWRIERAPVANAAPTATARIVNAAD